MALRPDVQAFLEALQAQQAPSWEQLSPDEGRSAFASLTDVFGEGVPIASVRDDRIEGVAARIFDDQPDRVTPAIVYFHGGGWVLGDLNTHDPLCRHLAKHSGCVVVSVDYSRAPEHRFPVALNECYAVTSRVIQRADDFGIEATKVAVAGDSAGGNLAAAVALKAIQEDGPTIAAQLLLYPVIEPRFDTDSYREFQSGYGLTRSAMQWFWDNYLAGDEATSLAAPIRAADLSRMPPAIIVTAEYDVLRDEGERFAEALRAAGVETHLERIDGTIHGFMHMGGVLVHGLDSLRQVAHQVRNLLD